MTDKAFFDRIINQICSEKSRFRGLSTVVEEPTALWLRVAMGKDLGRMTEK